MATKYSKAAIVISVPSLQLRLQMLGNWSAQSVLEW
jgi:hypothetical protein